MRITVLAVGKVKEKFYTEAIAEYGKRLSRYCKLEIIEVADEKTPDGAGEAAVRQIREKEGERILSHVKDGMYAPKGFRDIFPAWGFPVRAISLLSSGVPWGFRMQCLSGLTRP